MTHSVWPCRRGGGPSLAVVLLILLLAHRPLHAQQLLSDDEVVDLLDTPLMQVPIEQGTPALSGQRAPEAAAAPAQAPAPQAQLASEADTRQLCDAVVSSLAALQVREAFGQLARHWPLPDNEVARLAQETDGQFKQLVRGFGDVVGHEWIRSRSAGKSLVQHLYLIKLQYHGLRVACTFYKPQSQWQVHTVFWDDQLESLLER